MDYEREQLLKEKLKELDNQRLSILAELNGEQSISPDEVKELIKKYHGKCFMFEGYENGSISFKINTFEVYRNSEGIVGRIYINGTFIMYPTSDSGLLGLKDELFEEGGRLICYGRYNIDSIPYVKIVSRKDDRTIFKRINDALNETKEIPSEEFLEELLDIDDTWDSYGHNDFTPLDELDELEMGYIYSNI